LGDLGLGPAEVAEAGAFEEGAKEAVPVGGVDGGSGRGLKQDGIDVEEIGGPAGAGGCEKDVAGVEVGVTDPVAVELGEKFADGGEEAGADGGGGSAGEGLDKVLALGDLAGDDLEPVEGAGGVEDDRLDSRRGNFDFL